MPIRTNKNWRNEALPRMENEGVDVFPGSALAVIGLWVFALRERFEYNEAYPLPWMWTEELRPDDAEDGQPGPSGHPRKVHIESAYNTEKAVRNYRPYLVVGRGGGDTTADKVSVNNYVGRNKYTGFKAYHCYATMPVVIECGAESSGESSTIGDIVWSFILSTREIFRKDFGFHEITEPVMSDTLPRKDDKEIWNTDVRFQVQYDMRWGTEPIAPVLRDINLLLRERKNPEELFLELALRGSAD